MTYDLRIERWIPFRRLSGRVEWGSVASLVDDLGEDPVVAINASRPEFTGAVLEFLIGLLSASLQPKDEAHWRQLWDKPPTSDALNRALAALPDAFVLDGDGPRFMQDFVVRDFAEAEVNSIDRLLFDTPGEQTTKLNRDLFVKRGRGSVFGYPAAAMCLLAMQGYAPSGGQGHRTSMRGGGPLTTLVDPRSSDGAGDGPKSQSLWRLLWANVETVAQWRERPRRESEVGAEDLFPWLGATRTSNPKDGGRATTPVDAHQLQVYFGVPRRIRLEFGGPGVCDLTGIEYDRTVVGYRTRNFGVEYSAWRHPLSPYYRSKSAAELLPVHPQPDGLAWNDWVGLTVGEAEQGYEPAQVVSHFSQVRGPALRISKASLRTFGVDFDNMKCRSWLGATMPVFVTTDPQLRRILLTTATSLTGAAELVVGMLVGNIKAGLFSSSDNAGGDFSSIRRGFWEDTSSAFYSALEGLAQGSADEERALDVRRVFLDVLQKAALAIFDQWCPLESTNPETLRRVVKARYSLSGVFHPRTKVGTKLYTELGLAVPDTPKSPRRASKPRRAVSK